MLTIRLSRTGRKNVQQYRLVVQDKQVTPKSGNTVAILGHYDPTDPQNTVTFDKDKLAYYLKHGAQPSQTVARLLSRAGVAEVKASVRRYTHQVNPEKLKAQKEAEEAARKKIADEKAAAEAAVKAAAEAKAAEAAAPAPVEEAAPAAEEVAAAA